MTGSRIEVAWSKASEMSGFLSDESLEDMLVIAISQSGTTTDTNRMWMSQDLRARGSTLL